MMGKLFLVLALIPVAEIYVLVSVGSVIGVLPTIGLVLGTALVGAYLAREQGMAIVLRIRES
ncbi:MAG: FxsA family protein, partial [Desulfovibrionales bacterium]|nr:FxsA family protein [Desulfovibrionales bacterium]